MKVWVFTKKRLFIELMVLEGKKTSIKSVEFVTDKCKLFYSIQNSIERKSELNFQKLFPVSEKIPRKATKSISRLTVLVTTNLSRSSYQNSASSEIKIMENTSVWPAVIRSLIRESPTCTLPLTEVEKRFRIQEGRLLRGISDELGFASVKTMLEAWDGFTVSGVGLGTTVTVEGDHISEMNKHK